MKILIVGNLFPPIVFGGYELLCAQVVERLRERGHEVDILTSDFRAEDAPHDPSVERTLSLTTDFPRPGEEVHFVDFRLGTLDAVARRNYEITLGKLRQSQYDIVFCWCMNRLSLGSMFAARDHGVPVCYTVNDEHPKQYRWTPRPSGARQRARALAEAHVWPLSTFRDLGSVPTAVISYALKDSLLRQGTPLHHAEVIHQGIPMEQFPFDPARREPGDPFRLLYVGQLSAIKGVHTALRAVALLRDWGVDVRVTLVGSGVPDYEEELRTIVRQGGIEDRVEMLGKRPHSQVAEAYRSHHALVFPTEGMEGFGLSHMEAMASGCPVVSTTSGGSAELIRHGRNALSFKAGDPVDLADQVRLLAGSEHLRRRLSYAGRAWVSKHHDLEGYVSNLETFMERARRGEAVLARAS
jgi:glycosyltransferase involved in cell wall biosynthesis